LFKSFWLIELQVKLPITEIEIVNYIKHPIIHALQKHDISSIQKNPSYQVGDFFKFTLTITYLFLLYLKNIVLEKIFQDQQI